MCKECWQGNGAPAVWNENVKKSVGLIKKIYEHEPVGNPLHVVLDDWNLEDCFIEVPGDDRFLASVEQEAVVAARELVPVFLNLSLEERYSALAYAHDYLILPEPTAD